MEIKLKKFTFPLINYFGEKKERKKFTKQPIIIGGCARSGTTLILAILASHPSIYAIPKEIRVFKNWDIHKSDHEQSLYPRRIDRIYRHLLLHHIPKQCTRWCEKDTINIRYFDKILEFFKNKVKLIHIVRDGRDVMTSYHPLDPEKFWVEPDRWVYDMEIGLRYINNQYVYTVKYEDLVLNFEPTIHEIMDFIGENVNKYLLDWHKYTTIKHSKGWFHPVHKIHDKSIGRWKSSKFKKRIDMIMKDDKVVDILKQFQYIK